LKYFIIQYQRINIGLARWNINNVFSELSIVRVDKQLPGNVKGAAFQRHAITLAREGMTALQCIDEGVVTENPVMLNVARTYVKDIITMASAIGQQGSIDRVFARNPELAKIIKYKDDDNVLTPQMLQEIKEYKEANPARKFLHAAGRTGFGAFRRHNNNFNPSFGGGNFNNRNFSNNNNNNPFFSSRGRGYPSARPLPPRSSQPNFRGNYRGQRRRGGFGRRTN
jgi:hypothetical protein